MNHQDVLRSKGGTEVTQFEWSEYKAPNPDQMNDDQGQYEYDIARGK